MAVEQAMYQRTGGHDLSREVDWDRVYTEQLPRVYNFFRCRVANRADVEDLTSRTLEKAWQASVRMPIDKLAMDAEARKIRRFRNVQR